MLWGLLALAVTVWLAAIFYIVRGWGESKEVLAPPVEIPEIPPPKVEPEKAETEAEEKVETEEIEIPIEKPPAEEIEITPPVEAEDFYKEFGKANIVEFPAEYIDKDKVKSLSGNKIGIMEFAKRCYREIDYRCLDSVIVRKEKERIYKINIFDLISDHYSSTDEGFIAFFGQLKEDLAKETQSISNHPDVSSAAKRALTGKYEALPQLVVWNKDELFLVMVKANGQTLSGKEMDFLREFVIQKKIFKARIFRVTKRQKREAGMEEARPVEEKAERKVEVPAEKVAAAPRPTRKPFTKDEIKFLKENKDKFTNEELARELGRSIDSVTHKLSRLGIARESYQWTEVKDKFLKNNIKRLSYKKLAERLGTTIPSVRAKCKKLNIKK